MRLSYHRLFFHSWKFLILYIPHHFSKMESKYGILEYRALFQLDFSNCYSSKSYSINHNCSLILLNYFPIKFYRYYIILCLTNFQFCHLKNLFSPLRNRQIESIFYFLLSSNLIYLYFVHLMLLIYLKVNL
jgi:hypothetical protein